MKTKKFSMRLFVFLLIALCLVIYFIFLNNVKVSDKRPGVAYVSYTRVLNESSIMQQEKRRTEKVTLLAQEAERSAQLKNSALPEPQRREIGLLDKASLSNKLRVEAGRIRMISQNEITRVVESYRVKNHYSVVFNKDQGMTSESGQDISEAIIEELQGTKINYGELPSFKESE